MKIKLVIPKSHPVNKHLMPLVEKAWYHYGEDLCYNQDAMVWSPTNGWVLKPKDPMRIEQERMAYEQELLKEHKDRMRLLRAVKEIKILKDS